MKKVSFSLPYPPSANHYWFIVACKGGGRKVLGKKGKEYRESVKTALRGSQELSGRLKLTVSAHAPDRRKRDLDNILKALLDSMEDAGIYKDDNQIDEIHVFRSEPIKGGQVDIELEEIGDE